MYIYNTLTRSKIIISFRILHTISIVSREYAGHDEVESFKFTNRELHYRDLRYTLTYIHFMGLEKEGREERENSNNNKIKSNLYSFSTC